MPHHHSRDEVFHHDRHEAQSTKRTKVLGRDRGSRILIKSVSVAIERAFPECRSSAMRSNDRTWPTAVWSDTDAIVRAPGRRAAIDRAAIVVVTVGIGVTRGERGTRPGGRIAFTIHEAVASRWANRLRITERQRETRWCLVLTLTAESSMRRWFGHTGTAAAAQIAELIRQRTATAWSTRLASALRRQGVEALTGGARRRWVAPPRARAASIALWPALPCHCRTVWTAGKACTAAVIGVTGPRSGGRRLSTGRVALAAVGGAAADTPMGLAIRAADGAAAITFRALRTIRLSRTAARHAACGAAQPGAGIKLICRTPRGDAIEANWICKATTLRL